MLPPAVKAKCEEKLALSVLRVSPIGGGDINEARLLETSQGQLFLKMNDMPGAVRMFEKEAQGLKVLSDSGSVRVPKVLGTGQAQDYAFLILEYIEETIRHQLFWENFGNALASLHRHTNSHFGLPDDNYIGRLPQSNHQHERWEDFYILERLEPQASRAISERGLWAGAVSDFDKLYARIAQLMPEEPPALIHGDLWSGNFISGSSATPVLIDPAVSYAHREMDLAMTKLFGGFAPEFYQAYNEGYPCEPGLDQRIDIYQLYYLLVHVNLFGVGYVNSVQRIVKRYA